jgi:hypothetical protein
MKSFLSTAFIVSFFTVNSFAQNDFNFPFDSLTQKFTVSQIVELSGKTKSDIFQAFKTVSKQFTGGNSDKLSNDEVTKTIYINYVYDPVTDSSRMVYKLILLQVSTKNFKVLGYKSYSTLTMDMIVYVKEGKYKMELTNYNVAGYDVNHQGTLETIEKRNLNNKNWNKLKKEIYDDSEKSKGIINGYIANYFKKSDF